MYFKHFQLYQSTVCTLCSFCSFIQSLQFLGRSDYFILFYNCYSSVRCSQFSVGIVLWLDLVPFPFPCYCCPSYLPHILALLMHCCCWLVDFFFVFCSSLYMSSLLAPISFFVSFWVVFLLHATWHTHTRARIENSNYINNIVK